MFVTKKTILILMVLIILIVAVIIEMQPVVMIVTVYTLPIEGVETTDLKGHFHKGDFVYVRCFSNWCFLENWAWIPRDALRYIKDEFQL